jgi:hypothetical protein
MNLNYTFPFTVNGQDCLSESEKNSARSDKEPDNYESESSISRFSSKSSRKKEHEFLITGGTQRQKLCSKCQH